jgi:hypothetical protein
MGSHLKREEIEKVLIDYESGMEVNSKYREHLDCLLVSGQIEYFYEGKKEFARATRTGLKWINAYKSVYATPTNGVVGHAKV